MSIKIYADEMIIINIITNILIMTSADIINRFKTSFKKKLIISAFVSVIYVIGLILCFNFFVGHSYIFIILLAVLYSMPCSVYTVIKNYVIISIISCLSFGILNSFYSFNFFILLLTLVFACITARAFIYYISYKKYYSVSVFNNNKKIYLKALLDSGNLLLDPLTGKSVIIAEKDSLKNIYESSKLRKIPYKALGNEKGEFYAFDADKAVINNRSIKAPVIALYGSKISDNGKYNAIISLKHLGGK